MVKYLNENYLLIHEMAMRGRPKDDDAKKQLAKRLLRIKCPHCGKEYYLIRPACPFCGNNGVNKKLLEKQFLKYSTEINRLPISCKLKIQRAINRGNRFEYVAAVRSISETVYRDILRLIRKGLDFKQRW